jgi:hypothetical protein
MSSRTPTRTCNADREAVATLREELALPLDAALVTEAGMTRASGF